MSQLRCIYFFDVVQVFLPFKKRVISTINAGYHDVIVCEDGNKIIKNVIISDNVTNWPSNLYKYISK